jgi:Spy/CpxP family protein refolding chaperone
VVKELNLSPEKGKEFEAVGEKYGKSRKELFESLKKTRAELEKVLAAPKPDEAKIKELVKASLSDQDKLMDSFKAQRDEEMALLTTEQQGNFLVNLHKIRMEMYEKWAEKQKEKAAEKKEEKK